MKYFFFLVLFLFSNSYQAPTVVANKKMPAGNKNIQNNLSQKGLLIGGLLGATALASYFYRDNLKKLFQKKPKTSKIEFEGKSELPKSGVSKTLDDKTKSKTEEISLTSVSTPITSIPKTSVTELKGSVENPTKQKTNNLKAGEKPGKQIIKKEPVELSKEIKKNLKVIVKKTTEGEKTDSLATGLLKTDKELIDLKPEEKPEKQKNPEEPDIKKDENRENGSKIRTEPEEIVEIIQNPQELIDDPEKIVDTSIDIILNYLLTNFHKRAFLSKENRDETILKIIEKFDRFNDDSQTKIAYFLSRLPDKIGAHVFTCLQQEIIDKNFLTDSLLKKLLPQKAESIEGDSTNNLLYSILDILEDNHLDKKTLDFVLTRLNNNSDLKDLFLEKINLFEKNSKIKKNLEKEPKSTVEILPKSTGEKKEPVKELKLSLPEYIQNEHVATFIKIIEENFNNPENIKWGSFGEKDLSTESRDGIIKGILKKFDTYSEENQKLITEFLSKDIYQDDHKKVIYAYEKEILSENLLTEKFLNKLLLQRTQNRENKDISLAGLNFDAGLVAYIIARLEVSETLKNKFIENKDFFEKYSDSSNVYPKHFIRSYLDDGIIYPDIENEVEEFKKKLLPRPSASADVPLHPKKEEVEKKDLKVSDGKDPFAKDSEFIKWFDQKISHNYITNSILNKSIAYFIDLDNDHISRAFVDTYDKTKENTSNFIGESRDSLYSALLLKYINDIVEKKNSFEGYMDFVLDYEDKYYSEKRGGLNKIAFIDYEPDQKDVCSNFYKGPISFYIKTKILNKETAVTEGPKREPEKKHTLEVFNNGLNMMLENMFRTLDNFNIYTTVVNFNHKLGSAYHYYSIISDGEYFLIVNPNSNEEFEYILEENDEDFKKKQEEYYFILMKFKEEVEKRRPDLKMKYKYIASKLQHFQRGCGIAAALVSWFSIIKYNQAKLNIFDKLNIFFNAYNKGFLTDFNNINYDNILKDAKNLIGKNKIVVSPKEGRENYGYNFEKSVVDFGVSIVENEEINKKYNENYNIFFDK